MVLYVVCNCSICVHSDEDFLFMAFIIGHSSAIFVYTQKSEQTQ